MIPLGFIPRLKFPIAKEFFGGGPCTLETKHGKDVQVLSANAVTASSPPSVPIQEHWYTHAAQRRRAARVAAPPYGLLRRVPRVARPLAARWRTIHGRRARVPFRELWPTRGPARAAARPAADAWMIAALRG